uniref:Protein croquemort n=2 Tax=Bursaphelenchus xylophilus TaxID=6326 RepID=A0A1I7SGM8_BURXY
MHRMAFFNRYNNSADSEYEVYTGKDDLKKKGKIITWNGDTKLPSAWWEDDDARALRGTDSGQFAETQLNENSEVSFFQSYMCRSFTLRYRRKTSVHNIPTLRFESKVEEFDTTLPMNAGFRYANAENIKYFDNWPNCDNYTQPEGELDCDKPEFWCNSTCGGATFNGTQLMPPGMYPVNCYPGRPEPTPFRLLFSAPHFATAPEAVRNSVIGYSNLNEEATVFSFDYEPNSGTPLGMNIRFQVSIPFGKMNKFPTVRQFPNNIFPVFWMDNHNHIKKSVLDELYFGLITVPHIADIVAYSAIGIFLAFLVLTLFSLYRYRRLNSKPSGGNLN